MDSRLKKIIEESESIVFFGGAGVSTESGIPDFRSESGLYFAKQKYGYSPEEMLSHTFFMNKTELFFDYYRNNMIYLEAKPNQAHITLARLEAQGKLRAIITQNIDGLHTIAGSKIVHELHGSVRRNTCMECKAKYDIEYIVNFKEMIPRCKKCGGIIKPDVVLYEEGLDEGTVKASVNAIGNADTLIVGGTSLVVYPAAGLLNYFKGKEIVLINKSETGYDRRATLVINDSIGKVLANVV
ncbi:MAG: NAD-dependent protein deacylase [Peptostreptococcaceae bacterium]|nr:NAD-dependent protein deacylase [Peptostreptococcaceae bacterium]